MRVERVKAARKDQGTCNSCGKPITKGMAYKSISFRYGGTRKRHASCPEFRPSEMTQSKMSGVYAAQEGFEDAASAGFETVDDISDALSTAAQDVRNVAEEYQESAQNMEDGFGHETYQSSEMRENGDQLESWADDIDSLASELSGETVECSECGESEEDHHEFVAVVDHPEQCAVDTCEKEEDDHHEFVSELDDFVERASSAMSECPI